MKLIDIISGASSFSTAGSLVEIQQTNALGSSANVATLTDSENSDEKILTVESTGALNPKHIILTSVEQLANRLSEFKTIISDIK